MNNRPKKVITTELPKKTQQVLPKEVSDVLRTLPLVERKAYATMLSKEGWTLQSIANELKITREAVRLYEFAKTNDDTEVRKAVANLPVPPIPTRTMTRELIDKETIPDDVLAQLKELHAKARLVRGKGKNHRTEAEDFTRLVHEQVERGVSVYAIAHALGVTPSAISTRLIRYGYVEVKTGKSKVYRKLTNRITEQE